MAINTEQRLPDVGVCAREQKDTYLSFRHVGFLNGFFTLNTRKAAASEEISAYTCAVRYTKYSSKHRGTLQQRV